MTRKEMIEMVVQARIDFMIEADPNALIDFVKDALRADYLRSSERGLAHDFETFIGEMPQD